MVVQYWWLRYGNYRPGKWNLPHTGDVIVDYRRRRYSTQTKFAIAAGVDKQTVIYWENAMYLADPERRIFLARMLKISPALLGLAWQQVIYQDNAGETYTDSLDHLAELIEEDAYYHYEDTLSMAWGWFYSGSLLEIADKFERRLTKLENMVQHVPERDKEAWKWLLCQYLNLYIQIIQHRTAARTQKREALRVNANAIRLALDIDDPELIALSCFARASIHDEQKHHIQAKVAIQETMKYTDKIGLPLSGNTYLLAASYIAPLVGSDKTLEKTIRGWQDKALDMVYKAGKNLQPDNSYLKFNLAGVHHERARLFLQLHQNHSDRGFLKDAQNEIKLAWEAFTPDIVEWAMYFHLTEAKIFEQGHSLEESAKSGIEALKAAKVTQSKKREPQIRTLYYDLMKVDAGNPYVHNLGVELGIFQ